MAAKDPRVDAYIAQSADFARPILNHLRKLIHRACPEVEETLKWGMPYFLHKGILCGMASFKNHCAFVFWKGSLIFDKRPVITQDKAMGQFGRLTSTADLPSEKVLVGYIRDAVRLNDAGVKVPANPMPERKRKKKYR